MTEHSSLQSYSLAEAALLRGAADDLLEDFEGIIRTNNNK